MKLVRRIERETMTATLDPPVEIWRPVLLYEGDYEVSDLGRVRRMGRLRCPQKNPGTGYWRVNLSYRGKAKNFHVHTLVSEAFLGPRPAGQEVNHRDGNKDNNRALNLEYLTKAENARHAYAVGLMTPDRGPRNGSARLTDASVLRMRASFQRGLSVAEIARQSAMSYAAAWKAVHGQSWRHLNGGNR